MAINSTHIVRNKIDPKPKGSCSTMSQDSNGPSHVMTFTITTTQSSINSDSRCRIARKKGLTSPYLTGDKVKLSRVAEKKVVYKKPIDYVSPLPLATNIYRANSDEFRYSKQNNKKVKKSVLTLPNESNADGIVCTVSDVNDVTEYNKDQRDREHKIKNKKRLSIQTRKPRITNKNFEYYDRDARYCSQMNIDLDCSSTDMIKHYNGDGKKVFKRNPNTKLSETESKLDPHDVWAVLRNINQFQFTPSPPMSDYSIQSRKKKKNNKRRNSRKNARVIETCRTEEFAYISSYDVNRSRTSFSQASSLGRITVIDKQDEFSQLCQEFEKKIPETSAIKDSKKIKVQNKLKLVNQNTNSKRNNKFVKSNSKSNTRDNQLMLFNDEKVISNTLNEDQHHDSNKGTVENITNTHNAGALHIKYDADMEASTDEVGTDLHLSLSPYNETLCSVNSGSSKAGLNDFVNKTKAEGNKSIYSDESKTNQQMKGITKVVLSKAPDGVIPKHSIAPIRKPRLVTTMPSTLTPKLTQTDIKRRLAGLKFPIVVLERDELGCSSIEVPSSEPVQFRGLDQHIWPFMLEWQDNIPFGRKNNSKNNENTNFTQQQKGKHTVARNTNNNSFIENRINTPKEKKFYIYNTKKTDPKRINALAETKITVQQPTVKSKPMKFKDKMLKLLYKKTGEDLIPNISQVGGQGDIKNQRILQNSNEKNITKVDAGTDAVKMSDVENQIQTKRLLGSPQRDSIRTRQIVVQSTGYPWAKGKWASDFIDSVIKKVKNGMYYSQEKKVLCTKCCAASKEASIQTALTMKSSDDLRNICRIEDTADETSDHKIIPGFDDVLAPVEVKTLNMKQITVKHCLTNVLLQFEVSTPTEKKPILFESQRGIFTPLIPTDYNNHTKIIKCKTTILNAIMPAELCSIIPKMLRNISDLKTNLPVMLPSISPRKPDYQLATITELTQPNCTDSFKYSMTPFTFMSAKLRTYLGGKFEHNVFDLKHKRLLAKETRNVYRCNYINMAEDLLIRMVPLLYHRYIFNPILELTVTLGNKILPPTESSKCMALQPYIAPKQCAASNFGIHNAIQLLQNICCNNIVINFDFPKYFPVRLSDIRITLFKNMTAKNIDIQDLLPVTKNLKINSLFNGFLKAGDCRSETAKCIEYYERPNQIQVKKQKSSVNLSHTKTKKCFVRLYKKCKSTSNIAVEKSATAICKITNLDHFFQALGSGKLLSSVFDGYAEKKIMTSLAEMKNWISDISQRQAMLVLLLSNKKDTPNLVRYRPLLLQGIAVNRITRASELDMEIEVIETENLNKPQYEGVISYLPTSAQNNSLLEELYWIAKTTASDYQKPFDESSERLLKSLTEKRKKLNPSYLRVMARYVGLGLLKHPKK